MENIVYYLYIASGLFNFNVNGGYFLWKKRVFNYSKQVLRKDKKQMQNPIDSQQILNQIALHYVSPASPYTVELQLLDCPMFLGVFHVLE